MGFTGVVLVLILIAVMFGARGVFLAVVGAAAIAAAALVLWVVGVGIVLLT